MKRLLGILLLLPHFAAANPGDDKVMSARDAFRHGERVRLGKSLDALRGHELQPWVEYWQLRLRIEDGQTEDVPDFLARHAGTYIAEKLRGDWLRWLGKKREWEAFQQEYPKLAQPEQELACFALQARLDRQQDVTALDEARPLWFSLLDMPESCMPLMEQLLAEKRLDADAVWERVRRLLEAKKLPQAKLVFRYLPQGQAPDAKTLDAIADKPARHIARLPANFAATRRGREMALFAIQRMAKSDPAVAAAQWQGIEERFSAAERAYAWGQLAWQAAYRHMPEALAWYARAAAAEPTVALAEEQLAWKVRAALRAHDWSTVKQTVEQMPPQLAGDAAWVYWLARALDAHGKAQEAQALYLKIAGRPNFYGNLADEELGRGIIVPPRADAPTRDEIAAASSNSGLRRALALIALDMRTEGIKEWSFALRGMQDRQLLAAAEYAHQQQAWDRAINTADRTQAQHDYGLRYLAPFRDQVESKAKDLALDTSWIYGLMRQESRFITNAKSSVGAQGLMQVMPATARWTARRIGLSDFKPHHITDRDTNIAIGTGYLKLVLESFDGSMPLAAAAYNAGPSRSRAWRGQDGDPMLEAAIWAENVPFNETRDYVKKVLSNTTNYAALITGRPQSLKARLGQIGPQRPGKSDVYEDLP